MRKALLVFTLIFIVLVVPCFAQTDESPWIDVTDFGAVGNGATDSTRAIQSAIDFAHSKGGGAVLIPKGVFVISGAGLLVNSSTVSISGMGDRISILKYTGAKPAITIGDGSKILTNNTLEDIGIVGNKATSHGILLSDQTVRYTIERVSISEFKSGTAIATTDRNHSGHISNVEIWNNRIGISLNDRSQFTDISFSRIYCNSLYGIEMNNCNVISIISTMVERNGSEANGASIIARGVDVLNMQGCYNSQTGEYPSPFLVLTKGNTACHAINVTGCMSSGSGSAPVCLNIDNAENISFIGNIFTSYKKGILNYPLGVTSVKYITWSSNNVKAKATAKERTRTKSSRRLNPLFRN